MILMRGLNCHKGEEAKALLGVTTPEEIFQPSGRSSPEGLNREKDRDD